jgi:NADH-ubiquinone oxidoreductase chain 2
LNPLLSLSLAITIFSFVGVPPLLGFFGKQMVLSAALDKNLIFLSLVAILTSVIGAIYYLSIIKEMFFNLPEYTIKKEFSKKYSITDIIYSPYKGMTTYIPKELSEKEKSSLFFKELNGMYINLSNPISFTISCITLIILMFIFINKE